MTTDRVPGLAGMGRIAADAEAKVDPHCRPGRLAGLPDVEKTMELVNWQRVPWHMDRARSWLSGEIITENDKRQASAHLAAALELLR